MTDRTPHLSATAAAYDAVAERYAVFARAELARLPLDRAYLAAFAELATSTGRGPVAEVGCGPGRITAHLHDLGLDAFGVDLSPSMIELARTEHPAPRFEVGSMDALDVADDELLGIVAWYSVIHAPPGHIPRYFAEFRRTLLPGGQLLLAFFESEGGPVEEFDHAVAPAYRWPIDTLARLASEAGFTETSRMLREPQEGERFRRGHLLLRKAPSEGLTSPSA